MGTVRARELHKEPLVPSVCHLHFMEHRGHAAPPLKTPEGTSSPWWTCRALTEGLSWNRSPVGCVGNAGKSWDGPHPCFTSFVPTGWRDLKGACERAEPCTESSGKAGHANTSASPWPLAASVIFAPSLQWISAVNVLQQHKILSVPTGWKGLASSRDFTALQD